MAVYLTPRAVERVRHFIAQQPAALGLRFGVTRMGCSGWGYITDLAFESAATDTICEQGGVRIYIDPASLALVDGTEIDFGPQGLGQAFSFKNPNAAAACGCGESFTTDIEKA